MEINGIAHVMLTSSDFAAARAFYGKLLPFFGMKPVIDVDEYYYCVGGRTPVGGRPRAPGRRAEKFGQQRGGRRHPFFWARAGGAGAAAHGFLKGPAGTLGQPPQRGPCGP